MGDLSQTYKGFEIEYMPHRRRWRCDELQLESEHLIDLQETLDKIEKASRKGISVKALYLSRYSMTAEPKMQKATITSLEGGGSTAVFISINEGSADRFAKKRAKALLSELMLATPENQAAFDAALAKIKRAADLRGEAENDIAKIPRVEMKDLKGSTKA